MGHGGLILWALFGGLFLNARDPLPVQASNVSLISSEEFAALALPNEAPVIAVETPVSAQPSVQDDAPIIVPASEVSPDPPKPEGVKPPAAEGLPAIPESPITPQTDVVVQAPNAPAAPAIDEQSETVQPDQAPTPAPAPRVAPIAAPAPALDAEIAETTAPEIAPDESADTPAPETPATAPKEAATEIVTEAETPRFAPKTSQRPKVRPVRPVQTAKQDEPGTDPISDAVAEAVASETPEPAQPTGPPLTGGQIEGFRVAVGNCWNVDSGSAAARVTVTVGFSLDRSGKLVQNSLKFVTATQGESGAINAAFEAARRAIIRCGAKGYELPLEKYPQWKDIELTFNPEGMRIK